MIKILVTGDFSPQCRVAELIGTGKSAVVFENLKPLTAQMDLSVTNFETTVADNTDTPIEKYGPNLKCTGKSIKVLKDAGFDMVTLANNHFYDYGDSGVIKTLAELDGCGIEYVGGGRSLKEASTTLYKGINGKIFAFINCCENEFSIATEQHGGCNPLNPVSQYYDIKEAHDKADYVVVIVHGGHEHFQLPSMRMKEIYRFFVDAGADAVINHHQHCYSGYEFYNGCPIVYGLGNFCFDGGPGCSEKWTEGFAAELLFGNDKVELKTHPYIQCRETPGVYLMKNRSQFDQQINSLNAIISDDKVLKQKVNEFYSMTGRGYESVFQPYNGRFTKSVWWHGLLPSFFKGIKPFQAYNYIFCESHLDRLRAYVASKSIMKKPRHKL